MDLWVRPGWRYERVTGHRTGVARRCRSGSAAMAIGIPKPLGDVAAVGLWPDGPPTSSCRRCARKKASRLRAMKSGSTCAERRRKRTRRSRRRRDGHGHAATARSGHRLTLELRDAKPDRGCFRSRMPSCDAWRTASFRTSAPDTRSRRPTWSTRRTRSWSTSKPLIAVSARTFRGCRPGDAAGAHRPA